jgi:hypothetical protein
MSKSLSIGFLLSEKEQLLSVSSFAPANNLPGRWRKFNLRGKNLWL